MTTRGVPEDPDYIISLGSFAARREPFPEAIEDDLFWFDPGRNQRMNLLLHLAPYSELILVTGVPGSGKTSLLRQFALRAASRWKIARVVADTTMSVAMLVRRVCDEAGVVLSDASADPMTLLSDHVRMMGLGDKSLILIVDDAHELSGGALAIIDQLLEVSDSCGRPLSVILAGSPRVQELINHPEHKNLARRCSHTLDLPPLTEDETVDYIRHRLTVCGYDPAILPAASIKKIHKAAGGIPARINQFAAAELAQHPVLPRERFGSGRQKSRRKFGHIHWLALAAAAAVAVFLYWPESVEEPPPVDHMPSPPGASAVQTAPAVPPTVARDDQPVPETLPATGDSGSTTADAGDEVLVEIPGEDEAPPADQAEFDVTGAPVEPQVPVQPEAPEPMAATPAPVAVPEVASPVIGQPSPPAVAAPAATAEPPASAVEATPSVASTPTPSATQPVPSPAPSKPAIEAGEKPVVAAAKPPSAANPDAAKREDWLLQQPPGHFTLQLMSSDKEASIVSFINKRQLGPEAAYFRTLRNGKNWYAAVYSVYPSRDAAVAAADGLPPSLADIKPWVRNMAAVHADINAAGPE